MAGARIALDRSNPAIYQSLIKLAGETTAALNAAGVSRQTAELVNIRVSQLNSCTFCLDLHTRRALEAGESAQRLAVLPAWRETDLFDEAEKTALEPAEAVARIGSERVDDEMYDRCRRVLGDEATAAILWAGVAISTFNRLSVLSRHQVKRR